MLNVTPITIDNFGSVLNHGSGQAVIYFSASWCQPCHDMKPVFAELARQTGNPDIVFGAVDVAQSPTIAPMHGIRSVPSIAVFWQEKLVDIIAGQAPLNDVMNRIQHAFS